MTHTTEPQSQSLKAALFALFHIFGNFVKTGDVTVIVGFAGACIRFVRGEPAAWRSCAGAGHGACKEKLILTSQV
jgi:hypothetical protein